MDPWGLSDGLRVLVYGASGTGKTTFAGSFPGKTLWLLCSGGKKPGELRSINTPENRGRIRPVVVESFEHFGRLLADLDEYDNYVLDHVSGFSDLVLSKIIGRPVPEQKSWGLASQQQYGQLALQMKESLRELLNAPGNVIIIGQERVFGGKDDGLDPELITPTVGVALTPGVANWLYPACDYVVQAFKRPKMKKAVRKVGDKEIVSMERDKGVEYCLRVEPHDVFTTKFRVPGGLTTDVLVNPTYDSFTALLG